MDSVCGMTVSADGDIRADHEGRTLVFSSTSCRERFLADPLRYSDSTAPVTEPALEPDGGHACGCGDDTGPACGGGDHTADGGEWDVSTPVEHHAHEHAAHNRTAHDLAGHAGHGHAGHEGQPPVPTGNGEAVEYTCPMHPQIRRPGPGSCPICGMALEPVVVAANPGPNPELVNMTLRFWVGLGLAVPVVLLAMGRDLIGAAAPDR